MLIIVRQKNTCHFGMCCHTLLLSVVTVSETKHDILLFVGGNVHFTIEPEYQQLLTKSSSTSIDLVYFVILTIVTILLQIKTNSKLHCQIFIVGNFHYKIES